MKISLILSVIIFAAGTSVFSQNHNLTPFAEKYNQSVLGKNVFLFDPSMNMREVQSLIDTIFKLQIKKKYILSFVKRKRHFL